VELFLLFKTVIYSHDLCTTDGIVIWNIMKRNISWRTASCSKLNANDVSERHIDVSEEHIAFIFIVE
jgi:hypothetical protein